jgi:hypothetical protein
VSWFSLLLFVCIFRKKILEGSRENFLDIEIYCVGGGVAMENFGGWGGYAIELT